MAKKLTVYFKYTQHTNHSEPDEENEQLDHCWTTTSSKLEKKQYAIETIQDAFEQEDGDGDETGSWENQIILITDNKGNILFDPFDYKNTLQDQNLARERFLYHCKYNLIYMRKRLSKKKRIRRN